MRSKMGVIKSKMGRKFEQKRKAKWVKKKRKFGQGLLKSMKWKFLPLSWSIYESR